MDNKVLHLIIHPDQGDECFYVCLMKDEHLWRFYKKEDPCELLGEKQYLFENHSSEKDFEEIKESLLKIFNRVESIEEKYVEGIINQSNYKKCSECLSKILAIAKRCRFCGAGGETSKKVVYSQNRGGIAAVLNFFIPGLGYLYLGEIFLALFSFMIVFLGYFLFIVPGLILHGIVIIESLGRK